MSRFDPLVSIDRFRYADSTRTQKRRKAGSCPTLLNLAPNQGEGERVRRGFAAYTTITPPTGMQKFFILPVQSPSQEDIFLWFATSGVYQNPYWFGSTEQSTNIKIDETFGSSGTPFNPTDGDVTINAFSLVIANLATTGNAATVGLTTTIVNTDSYFRGFVIKNVTQTEYVQVTGYSVSSGTGTFTTIQDISSTGLNWATSDTFILYRNFHDNLGFTPAYNNNYTSPPFALSHISRLFFSGGLSSATGNVALISQYINRDFFPSDTLHTFTFTGTYVSEERLKAPPSFVTTFGQGNFGRSGLETDKTYWLAFAYVYDGFQIGELNKYETVSFYGSGGAWTRNYLASTAVTDQVASVTVTAGGSNYVNAGVTFTGGAGSGATATANLSSEAVVSVNVTAGGSGYTSAPTVGFSSGVKSVTVVSGGTGYSNGSLVTFTGGGGSGALGITVVSGGVITSITMLGYGSGYTSAPTPVVAGGGSGASLTAVVGSGATATSSLSTSTIENEAMALDLSINPATLNKRVTGILIFAAQDSGQTTTRQSDYFFIQHIPIDSTDSFGTTWVLASNGVFTTSGTALLFDGESWNGRGVSYIEAVGMEEIPPDTSYSYSSRLVVGHRHYLSNVYISSEAVANREEIFGNPIGALAGTNSGLNQFSLFPNDVGFYRRGVELALGTKINLMAKVDMGELLVAKDRGIIFNRIITNDDGTFELIPNILDENIGCSTLNAFTQLDADSGGLIFFAGYDDCYLYDNGNIKRLIEDPEQQDWLYNYREGISKANKESVAMTYLPEGILLLDIAQTASQQFQLYTQFIPDGWRQVAFKQTSGFASTIFFSQFGKLQNGTVLGLSTEGTPTLYQFSNPTTGAYYYADSGSHIRYQMDTGDIVTGGDLSMDTWLDRIQVARYFDMPMQGTLETKIYRDGNLLRTLSGMDKTSVYLKAAVMSDDPKIGNTWRLAINTNTSTPETLNAGTDFRIQGLRFYGHPKHRQRVSDAGYSSSGFTGGGGEVGTIAGQYEIIVNEADTTGTWDKPFTLQYVNLAGSTVPLYRFIIESAVVQGETIPNEEITVVSKSLTQIVLRSSTNNTLVKFRASEP